MEKSEKDKIIQKLIEKGANLPCPRCSNKSFSVVDGYFNQPLQGEIKGLVLGGPSIPSIVTVCNQCGFISQHALGALGPLPQKKEGSSNE
jgi:hypothetical protein